MNRRSFFKVVINKAVPAGLVLMVAPDTLYIGDSELDRIQHNVGRSIADMYGDEPQTSWYEPNYVSEIDVTEIARQAVRNRGETDEVTVRCIVDNMKLRF